MRSFLLASMSTLARPANFLSQFQETTPTSSSYDEER